MLFWAIGATILSLVLLIMFVQYKRQIKKNCEQLEVMQKHSSNLRLTSDLPYKEVNEMV